MLSLFVARKHVYYGYKQRYLSARAYSNGAVQPILCDPKSRMCSPSCKIVQSKICALNFHTNQEQELFSHLLHLQRWQVGAGNLFTLQAGRVCRISQWRCWFAAVEQVSRDTGAAQASDAFFHMSSIFGSEANARLRLPRSA